MRQSPRTKRGIGGESKDRWGIQRTVDAETSRKKKKAEIELGNRSEGRQFMGLPASMHQC